jgi:hypothetical protein
MDAVFKKMQLKDHERLLILGSPDSFRPAYLSLAPEHVVQDEVAAGEEGFDFILTFVKSCAEISEQAPVLDPLLLEDGLFWWAYPKKSSRKYDTDISRDNGWQPLGNLGYEPVRQVAIDADWSALRFRKAEKIRVMKRDASWAMSEKGKEKTRKRKN